MEKTNLVFLDVTQSIHQGQWRRASLEQSALEGLTPTCSQRTSLPRPQPWALNALCYVLGEEVLHTEQSEVYRMCKGQGPENTQRESCQQCLIALGESLCFRVFTWEAELKLP